MGGTKKIVDGLAPHYRNRNSMWNKIPEDLIQRIGEFVNYYNNHRYHESLNNITPADVFFRRNQQIVKQRQIIKLKTMTKRRKSHIKKSMQFIT